MTLSQQIQAAVAAGETPEELAELWHMSVTRILALAANLTTAQRDDRIREELAAGTTVAHLSRQWALSGSRVRQIGREAPAAPAGGSGRYGPGVLTADTGGEAPLVGEVLPALMGPKKELILAGRASLVELGIDPEEDAGERAEAQLRRATPQNTIDTMRWGWGFVQRYCGIVGRRCDPPTVGTVRKLIADAWFMTDKDGNPPGEDGQPYSPRTIATAVYVLSMICNRMQWVNPVRHPLVTEQLKAYQNDYDAANYHSTEADALSPEQNMILARYFDRTLVQGLRNAAMIRGQFDMGCRADEWCRIDAEDVDWVDEKHVRIKFRHTKGRKQRTVSMQDLTVVVDEDGTQYAHPDADVDPVALFLAYWRARQAQGWDGRGPVWVEVVRGYPRKGVVPEGLLGTFCDGVQLEYDAYAKAFARVVAKTGIDRDPVTGRKCRRYSTHSERVGHITNGIKYMRPDQIARGTGHALEAGTFWGYVRRGLTWDDENTGVAIRLAAAAAQIKAAGGAVSGLAAVPKVKGKVKPVPGGSPAEDLFSAAGVAAPGG